jgi:hypothetical protein
MAGRQSAGSGTPQEFGFQTGEKAILALTGFAKAGTVRPERAV